ncbi:SDR family NAD(P)-dependent oxidoreductase [Alkalihalobacillus sp. TS-13]|uniref:SDR family NAD(P)-dependent oxidoreductase n=1 Tax=Alkalihalobacillus sp. TS-13 TaxID=2842455 RepID=UPI001C87B24D|nr:SDR family NAD(P)-dependent oxidoreductase [Alkalihalobacillus sp. TS-13]
MNGKVVIITGSTKGIGKSIAQRLATEGAAIVINGRDKVKVEQTVEELKEIHNRIIGVTASVSSEKACKRIIGETIASFGRVDVLINNAGITRDRISYKMTMQEWDDVIETHLKGTFACTKHAVLAMRESGVKGTIINVTSKSGMEGLAGQLNYSAAKAGVNGMTRTLAKELDRFGITVYAIAPVAETDMTLPVIEMLKKEADKQGKALPDEWSMGSPDDVAILVSTILEEHPETGSIFSVNGEKIGRWKAPEHEMILPSSENSTDHAIFHAFSKKRANKSTK